ncbi:hypothetical protein B5V02_02315 [Mesorhizobium kowhaii]|uniref:Uncharacterized protein n=1 Tax=Mesorhizobium kowhaii TaxID=1300272 RepID=A0A2W7CCW8_9HYPH|nr:hypothetical protein B5V02_02315 [Mesorhizobium kowhaii]
MSLALAGQFTSKFSGGHHDTKVMNLGRPLPEPTPGIGRQRRRRDTGKSHDTLLLYTRRQSHRARFDGLFSYGFDPQEEAKLFISRIPDAGTVVHVKVPYHPRRCNRLAADDDSSGPTAAAGVLV